MSNHINSKVIQRSRGGSALQRLADGADPEFADECNFVMAVAFRETRVNAQEGRAVDFSLPRELPEELLLLSDLHLLQQWKVPRGLFAFRGRPPRRLGLVALPVASFVIAAFVRQDMAVRIDIECPQASDNGRNPHVHAFLAMRVLEPDGFGQKAREWNQQFRYDFGRYFRAVIAARVTLGCALVGVAAHMDPRRNEERGLPQPEQRIPAPLWRMYDRLSYVAPIENLKAERVRKKKKSAETPSAPRMNTSGTVVVSNAVSGLPGHGSISLKAIWPQQRSSRAALFKILRTASASLSREPCATCVMRLKRPESNFCLSASMPLAFASAIRTKTALVARLVAPVEVRDL